MYEVLFQDCTVAQDYALRHVHFPDVITMIPVMSTLLLYNGHIYIACACMLLAHTPSLPPMQPPQAPCRPVEVTESNPMGEFGEFEAKGAAAFFLERYK